MHPLIKQLMPLSNKRSNPQTKLKRLQALLSNRHRQNSNSKVLSRSSKKERLHGTKP